MGISDSLEVGIGLSFVFVLLSLVLTSVNEMIETVLKARGAKLFEGIGELVNGTDLATILYGHPLIASLMRGDIAAARAKRLLPSYVPTRNFALALIGQLRDGWFAPPVDPQPGESDDAAAARGRGDARASIPAAASVTEQLRFAAERIENDQLRRTLIQAIAIGDGRIEAVQAHLEGWFDSGMDRVSGWYKRRTQRITFVLGLLVAVFLNVNTLTIGEDLFRQATLRQAIVAEAGGLSQDKAAGLSPAQADAAIEKTGLAVGWSDSAVHELLRPYDANTGALAALGIVEIVAGFLLTAFAVTLGAPFWFDVLNRLMVIRATVKPTEKSRDEASQDPQPRPDATGPTLVIQQEASPPQPPAAPAIDRDVYARGERPELFEDDTQQPVKGYGR